MRPALRVLLVEDSSDDAELVLEELRHGGFDLTFERVETKEEMVGALDSREWDIVLSDYSLPRFSAPAAFATLTDKRRDLPFIIVSGTIGEEVAVGAMKLGIQDYILKSNLTRLCAAVERELREHSDQRQVRDQLRRSDDRYRHLFESSPLAMWVYDIETLKVIAANEEAVRLYGYGAEEFCALTVAEILDQEDESRKFYVGTGSPPPSEKTWRHRRKDGTVLFV